MSMLIPSEVPLTQRAFDFLANLVYQRSRIRLGTDKHTLVAGRLRQRLQSLGLENYDDYCDLLKSLGSEDEIDALIDLISTNHTHFFRENSHFETLSRHILPTLASRAQAVIRPLEVWCAAASSGEEVYSLAIVLAEFCRSRSSLLWNIEASDISHRMLQRCQQGIYEAQKVELPSPEWLNRYFQLGFGDRDGFLRVKAELRRRVSVQYINLFQDSYPIPEAQDLIFCRNVMIYFDTQSRSLLLEKLTAHLAPGGYLFVGHSESLIGIRHSLKPVWPSIYMRPE